MKTNLLLCFLLFTTVIFGKEDKEIIIEIDNINSRALDFYNNNEIVKSFKEFIIAEELSDSIQDYYGNAISNFNLGNIYYLMENYESAKDHYQLTLSMSYKINNNYLIASSYLKIGKILREENNYKESIKFFKKALEYSVVNSYTNESEKEKIKTSLFEARTNLCEIYIENNQLNEALINLLKLDNYLKSNVINSPLQGYYKYIYGIYYVNQELYNNATIKFKQAINLFENSDEEIDLVLLSEVYMQLSISLAKSGRSTDAYVTLLEQNSYKNKLQNVEKNKQDLIVKSKFLIEDYKNNAAKANEERLQQLAIANKFKKINYIIFITLILLLASLVLIFKSYKSKIKLSKTLKVKNSELEIAKNEALKSSEMKSRFISNVSHELRTPLYGVVGLTSIMLENNNFNKRDEKYLKSLKYSGDYLLNLINDILQVGKIESNKVELDNTSVNLKRLIQDVTDSFDYSLEESNNEINVLIDDCIPEYILCDKIRLTQVLFNLIGNSIKFTQNGNILVKAILQEKDDTQVSIRFEINDNGPGIPKEKQASIFENFTQLSENSNTNYQGAGLGLSIASKIVKLFNSDIELESELGKGATFSFNVKFEIDLKAINNNESKEVKSIFSTSRSEKIKVLIAEDNKINQIVTGNLLKKQNIEFDIVENGLEALKAFEKNTYNLVLMDLNMPVMNGKEATSRIREINNKIPVVALTASSIDELSSNELDVVFDDIITKPFDNELFFNTINKLIELSKAQKSDKKKDVIELAS